MLVRTMAEALDLGFSRIQFTPDLMPADIVGTNIIVEEGGERRFRFQQGPIFSNLVLADEINRATPKTQSALLEAMQEHRVTVAKQQYTLSEPFFVLATQNPLEMEGTYPLPEAQLDRFFFKIDVPFPSEEDLIAIMDRTTGTEQPQVGKAATGADVLAMQRVARDVPIASHVMAYAIRILRATHPDTERVPGDRQELRPLRRIAPRRAGHGAGREDPRPARRPLQRRVRRCPGSCAAGAAASGHPQLRGRGRGNQHRFGRARDHRRDAHRTSRVAVLCRGSPSSVRSGQSALDGRTGRRGRSCARRCSANLAASALAGATSEGIRPPSGRSARPAGLARHSRSHGGRAHDRSERAVLFDETFLRRLEQLELASRRMTAGRMKGERRSVRRGQSVEFADYRNYAVGDDLRQLDWNAYARLEKLFVKLFVEEEDVTVHLLVDASRSMDYGEPNKLDAARRAAAALGYLGLASMDRVSVAFLGDGAATGMRPMRGKRRALELFKFLSEPRPERLTGLASAARAYAGRIRGRGPMLLISDLMDPGYLDALRDLAGTRCQLSVLHMLAPDELEPRGPAGRAPGRQRDGPCRRGLR